MIESLKQALTDAKRNERHNNVAETRYWLNQYKLIAEQAIAQHPPQRTWVELTNGEIEGIKLKACGNVFSAIMFTNDRLEELNK
jgi:hypothetical protein